MLIKKSEMKIDFAIIVYLEEKTYTSLIEMIGGSLDVLPDPISQHHSIPVTGVFQADSQGDLNQPNSQQWNQQPLGTLQATAK